MRAPRAQRRWTGRTRAAVGLSAVATVACSALGTLATAAPAHRGELRPAPLVEAAWCDDPTPARPAVAPGDPGAVSVTVPPTALLWVDRGGRVVAASTNTGCAPRPADDVRMVRPDGSIEPAPTSLAHRRWRGDFTTPGLPVPQRP